MHMPVREAKIHQMRERNQRSAETYQRRVHGRAVIEVDDDAADQQRDARYQKPERTELLMAAEPDYEHGQRECACERDEDALVLMIGKEREAQGWQGGKDWEPGSANFAVIKEWNKSEVYAKTIGYFATQLSRAP